MEIIKECKHSLPLEVTYGKAYRSGWKGMGTLHYCGNCYKTLWMQDDDEVVTEEEKTHNNNKRLENKEWNPRKHELSCIIYVGCTCFIDNKKLKEDIDQYGQ